MIKCPCQGCEKRTMNCHSTCEEYKAYSTNIRAKRQLEWEQRVKQAKYEDYKVEIIRKTKKGD